MRKPILAITILAGLFLISMFISLFIENPSFDLSLFQFSVFQTKSSIAIIPVYGSITSDPANINLLNAQSASPEKIKLLINNAKSNPTIKAVIFDINSPGGAVVPSQEIASLVKQLNKTKYAVISDVGASGAYWIASSCDKIIANPLSITGSIGVTSSYFDFTDLFEKYGINYNTLIAGSLKEIGSPYKNLTTAERSIMQNKLNIIHAVFASDVAINRNMTFEQIKSIATGEFYLGLEAKELGLIDDFGNKEKAIEDLKLKLNITNPKIIEYKEEKNLLEMLTKISSYYIGQGIGAAIAAKSASVSENFEIRIW